jgi:putative PIN family toxin of toxin-antitoxin system
MTTELRVVLDTNVIVSQLLLPRSVPAAAVRLALRHGIVLSSAAHMRELFEVAARPKFNAYISMERRLEEVRRLAGLIEPVQIVRRVKACRDPKDDILLEIAVNGRASHIVTGDTDLLVLGPFEGISIVDPAAFLRSISQE